MSFLPPVSSYAFHIYYYYRDVTSLKDAIQLKNAIFANFKQEVDDDHIVLKVLRNEEIRGPHITAFFEVDTDTPDAFAKFFSWIQLNHGSSPVLIHPNSDDTHKDHTERAAWLGAKLPLLEEELKSALLDNPNYGFPSRQLIEEGFYDDPEQYKKSILIRLLDQGPVDKFY